MYSKEFEGRQDRQLASNILAIMVAKAAGNLRTPALVASKQSAVTLRDTLFSRQTPAYNAVAERNAGDNSVSERAVFLALRDAVELGLSIYVAMMGFLFDSMLR